MPFTFVDILILRYLLGVVDENQTVTDFNIINLTSDLNWSLKSQLAKFIKRFWKEPYKDEEKQWMQELVARNHIRIKEKFAVLRALL